MHVSFEYLKAYYAKENIPPSKYPELEIPDVYGLPGILKSQSNVSQPIVLIALSLIYLTTMNSLLYNRKKRGDMLSTICNAISIVQLNGSRRRHCCDMVLCTDILRYSSVRNGIGNFPFFSSMTDLLLFGLLIDR